MNSIEDLTWDDLMSYLVQDIHCGLLEGGSRGMKSSVSNAIQLSLRWKKSKDETQSKEWTDNVDKRLVKEILESLERSPSGLSPVLDSYRSRLNKIKANTKEKENE